MSTEDVGRAEFERWAKQKGLNIGLNWNNSYSHVAMVAWDAWNASRESLVVVLPDYLDTEKLGFLAYEADAVDAAIEAAGVRMAQP